MDKSSEQNVRERIRSVILELAPDPGGAALGDPRLVEDLNYHSLALLELGFTLEDEFDLPEIDQEAAQQITTMKAVEDFIVAELRRRTDGGPTEFDAASRPDPSG